MRRWIVAASALLCAAVFALGWAVTPRVDGRPVLLSPAVRGVLRYAGQGEEWTEALGEVEQLLLTSLPASGGDVALPAPEHARVHPGALLAYAEQARRARDLAVAVAKEVDTTRPPAGLEPLHGEALALARGYAALAGAVQEYLAVPTAAEAARIGAELVGLSARREALARDYRALALEER